MTATEGGITDASVGDSDVDVYAVGTRLTASTHIGELSADGALNPIETELATVTAATTSTVAGDSGSIAIVEATDITVATGGAQSDLESGSDGSIVLITVDGSIAVEDGADNDDTGVIADGAGNVLLQAQGTGNNLNLNADVVSGTGSISLLAANNMTQSAEVTTAGSGSIDAEATGGSIVMTSAATAETAGGNIRYKAGEGVILGVLDAGSGDVGVIAGSGSVVNADAGPGNDVTADELRIVAGADVGADADHVETTVNKLAVASSGTDGIFVTNSQAVTVGEVGTVAAHRVQSDGTVVPEADGAALSDLEGVADGSIVLSTTSGVITVEPGNDSDTAGVKASGAGSVLLDAQSGDVLMTSEAGLQTDGQTITVLASGHVVIGLLDARAAADRTSGGLDNQSSWGEVSVTATEGGITDSSVGDGDVDVYAAGTRLTAQSNIGELAADGALNPIETELATVTAQTTSTVAEDSGSIAIVESTDITVATVGTQSDLESGSDGSIVLITVDGSITVEDGADDDDTGVIADGAGNVLLQVQGAGKDLFLNADVVSATGSISLLAADNVTQSVNVSTGGSGSIDVEASGGSIAMASGVTAETAGGNIRYKAQTDVMATFFDAGTGVVGITAVTGSITDGDATVDITAKGARLFAGYGIGDTTDPFETSVDTISAFAGPGGIQLLETDDVTIGSVDLLLSRVTGDGATRILYDDRQSGVTAEDGGFIVLENNSGTITIEPEPARAIIFPGEDWEITATADTAGDAFNGYGISIVDDAAITDDSADATYDTANLKVTVTINDGVTTATHVVDAINSLPDFPFTAFQSSGTGSEAVTIVAPGGDFFAAGGSERGVASLVDTVTAGGAEAVPATATLQPVDADFGIEFTAKTGGAHLTGVTIRLLDDGIGGLLTDEADAAHVDYDDADHLLGIYINNGYTRVQTIINTVNGDGSVPFTATLTGNADGTEVFHTAPVLTVIDTPARATVTPPGNNNDLLFEAASPGVTLNDVTIRFVDDGTISGNTATATYFAGFKTLIVRIDSDTTDAGAVIDAVTSEGTFLAGLDTTNETGNNGTGTIQSHVTTTSGGGTSSAALAVVRPDGPNNDIRFDAKFLGEAYNDVAIRLVDDPSIIDGSAVAAYDGPSKTLTIHIQSQFTDANAVISAVNSDGSLPFAAANDGGSTGIGNLNAFEEGLTSGGISDTAEATLLPDGDHNDLVFTAETAGSQYAGVFIQVIDDGTIADGSALADYDAANKILTINIQNGATTAEAVRTAVNSGPNAGKIPFTTDHASDSDGSRVIHTPAPITAAGADALSASLTLELPGDNNDVIITAESAGVDASGVQVFLVQDDTITPGNAQAIYDDADEKNRTLTVRVKINTTTAEDVIYAINDPGIPFAASAGEADDTGLITTATLLDPSGRGPGFITIDASTDLEVRAEVISEAGGLDPDAGNDILFSGAVAKATGIVDPTIGSNNEIDLEAVDAGERFNDLSVSFVGNLDMGEAGDEVAEYDPETNTLRVGIEDGVTTANQVIAAIIAEGTFLATPSGTSDGSGTVSEELFSDVTSGGFGQSGALQAVVAIDLTAGGSVANLASTALITISGTGTAGVAINSGATAKTSSHDLVVDSRGGFVLTSAGLHFDGADVRVSADDDLDIQAEISAPNDAVILSSEDNVHINAPITGATIDVEAGTDGTGDVIFTALLTGGNVALWAAAGVTQNSDISVTGDASVSVTALSGGISMDDGIHTSSVNGAITYTAGQDMALTAITSTTGIVSLTAGGNILDNTVAESANVQTGTRASFAAVTGIGSVGAGDIDTDVVELDAVNSGDTGDIVIEEVGEISIIRLAQAHPDGSGNIILTTIDGDINVVEAESGVSVRGSGSILLQAGGGGDVAIQADVSAKTCRVSIIAADRVEQNANVSSGATGSHAAGTITPTNGSNNAIDLFAMAAGKNFNNLTVNYWGILLPGQAGNEVATYDPGTNTLTVAIADGVSTANQVLAAVLLERTFYATHSIGSDGTGTLSAELISNVTSGGTGDHAAGRISPATGNDNAIDLEAAGAGQNLNGLTVVYVKGVLAGNEIAIYNAVANILTVTIEDGVTTANQVIAAINVEGTFFATHSSGSDGTGSVSAETFVGVTVGGTGVHAIGVVDNAMDLVSVAAGENFNELNVVYVGDVDDLSTLYPDLPEIDAGQVVALYIPGINTLGIAIEDGVTTINQVIAAINIEGTFYVTLSSGTDGSVEVSTDTFSKVTRGDTIDVEAQTGTAHMGMETKTSSGGGDIRYHAVGNVTVSRIDAGKGNVSLISTSGSVLDNGDTDQDEVDKLDIRAAGLLITANISAGEPGSEVASGGTGPHAEGTITPTTGENNAIDLVAVFGGENFNNLNVEFDDSVSAGNETATYDPGSHTLTVAIKDGVTTANQVIAAINAQGTFTASNSAGTNGTGAVSEEAFSDVTSGGAGVHTAVTLSPTTGSNNTIDMVAVVGGENFN